MIYSNVYLGKKVLITGHTGFKGTWLTSWLLRMGAQVCGVSDCIPTTPSMFSELGLENKILHNLVDIRDFECLRDLFESFQPDFVFHLAAQPIVSLSYFEPLETISTNVMGTANVLESLKSVKNKCAAVIITSDKCYENVEWEWGYKETDHLGGRDIYSGSKGAAEVIFHAYQKSFFERQYENISMATGRAGNVIGGGDWAKDRIVVDCVKSWSKNDIVELRSPNATRPWQHVLEPLSGYLTLGEALYKDRELHGESFNFGPRSEQSRTVLELLSDLSDRWGFLSSDEAYQVTDNIPFHEAGLLKLNCDKALFHLKWEATWTYSDCVKHVGDWYYAFYQGKSDMYGITMAQIEAYEKMAEDRKLVWTL